MKTLIITGGKINKNFIKKHLKTNKYDIIIAVDKGLEALNKLKVKPTYIVGDFDSVENKVLKKYERLNIKIKRLVPEKDLTDTQSALELAIELGAIEIIMIGAIGTRIDHTLANIHIMKEAIKRNINIKIINENNEIKIIDKSIKIKKDDNYKYISIIPLTTKVTGITIKGMKYKLENYTLEIGNSLGISNEQISEEAEINITDGILIIIKSRD